MKKLLLVFVLLAIVISAVVVPTFSLYTTSIDNVSSGSLIAADNDSGYEISTLAIEWLAKEVSSVDSPKTTLIKTNGSKTSLYQYFYNDNKNKTASVNHLGANLGKPATEIMISLGVAHTGCSWLISKLGNTTDGFYFVIYYSEEALTGLSVGDTIEHVYCYSEAPGVSFTWSIGTIQIKSVSDGNGGTVNGLNPDTYNMSAGIGTGNDSTSDELEDPADDENLSVYLEAMTAFLWMQDQISADPINDRYTWATSTEGSTSLYYYFETKNASSTATVNSLGTNYGKPITARLIELGLATENNCSWVIKKELVSGSYYYTMYYTIQDLSDLASSDVVETVIRYTTRPDCVEWTVGTAAVGSASNGNGGTINSLDVTNFEVVKKLDMSNYTNIDISQYN